MLDGVVKTALMTGGVVSVLVAGVSRKARGSASFP
jgi:hypothetical protein